MRPGRIITLARLDQQGGVDETGIDRESFTRPDLGTRRRLDVFSNRNDDAVFDHDGRALENRSRPDHDFGVKDGVSPEVGFAHAIGRRGLAE